MKIENDLILRVLRGEETERVPVWMMRQAGRYLPEYMKLRDKYDFFTRVQTPELVTEITLQPIDIVGVDAAILFSDILVIPQAMGLTVEMVETKGPYLPRTIANMNDVEALNTADVAEHLHYVMDAVKMTKQALNGRVPLIGFAGAPWTILCYMVEGKGSKTWDKAKAFAYTQPEAAKALLQKITDITIDYLKAKVVAGADIVQVFDSWSGSLSPADYREYSQPYLFQISDALHELAPVILFPKGSWYGLDDLSKSTASAIGIDWCIEPASARAYTHHAKVLQGNFDPSWLLSPIPEIKKRVQEMLTSFGKDKYIANLGHGIMPHVPVDHAKAFVDAVKEMKW